jgi:hypothetical protein
MEITPITAVVGAITGYVSLIWNILTYVGFDLEIYDSDLSFEHYDNQGKELLKYAGMTKDTDTIKHSDDAIVLRGWFKFILRKEGQRFKNHHVSSLSIELDEELRYTLSNILADPPSYIALVPSGKDEVRKLFEGAPTEIKVHSIPTPFFLKKDWKSLTNMRVDELTEKLNDLLKKGENKTYVLLTTYKYPLAYEKKGDRFYRENLWKRTVNSIRWHLKI